MSTRDPATPDRADWRLAFVVGIGCAIFYTVFTHGSFKGSDEVGVFQVTESLYRNGSLTVPIHHHAHVGADGRLYHAWATGQSVLALPLYALAQVAEATLPTSWARAVAGPVSKSTRRVRGQRAAELRRAGLGHIRAQTLRYSGSLEIFFVCLFAPLAGGVLVAVFFLLQRELGVSTRNALVAAMLTGLCSYPAMMAVYFLRHTAEAIATLAAFALFHAYGRTGALRLLMWGSAAASSTVLVRFPAVLSALGLAFYVCWCVRIRMRAGARPGPAVFAIAGPLLVAAAIHCGLNYAKWGSFISSPMVSGGLEGSASFFTALSAFLWSPGISVFAYSPLLLLLPWTFTALLRTGRVECIFILIIALTELLYFSNYRFWTGLWSAPGPRYLFPACVLLMVPLGVWLDGSRTRIQNGLLWGLAGVGGVAQLALLTAKWSGVIRGEGYKDYEPQFSFLFVPDASPIVGSVRVALEGQIEPWLWKLGVGWPGQAAQPVVAAGLALAWIAACVAVLAWGRRVVSISRGGG
jgi:hypothetical protein